MSQSFIIPRNATPDDIERARPPGAGDRRWTGGRGAGRYVVDTAAVNRVAEPVTVQRREGDWWENIVNGLWHAWRAHELCDTWTLDDLADEMADQMAAEAQRLTRATEELVTVPNEALAAVAKVRRRSDGN